MTARLTTAQRARVRELVEDEGESEESATAWVRTFEPPGYVPWKEEPRDCLALALHGRTRGEEAE